MARSIFTASTGSGFKFATYNYTDGADSKHDELIVLGQPYVPTYTLEPGGNTNPSTSTSHMLQVMAGSSLNVYVVRILLFVATLAGAATVLPMQIRRLTTAGTGGTAGGFQPYDSSVAAAGATNMVLPTVKGIEGVTLWSSSMGALAAAPTVPGMGVVIFDWDAERLRTMPIRIAAGTTNGICLKNNAALATATYTPVAVIYELPY